MCKLIAASFVSDDTIAHLLRANSLATTKQVIHEIACAIDTKINRRNWATVDITREVLRAYEEFWEAAWYAFWRFCLTSDAHHRDLAEQIAYRYYYQAKDGYESIVDRSLQPALYEHSPELLEVRAKLVRARLIDWGADHHEPHTIHYIEYDDINGFTRNTSRSDVMEWKHSAIDTWRSSYESAEAYAWAEREGEIRGGWNQVFGFWFRAKTSNREQVKALENEMLKRRAQLVKARDTGERPARPPREAKASTPRKRQTPTATNQPALF